MVSHSHPTANLVVACQSVAHSSRLYHEADDAHFEHLTTYVYVYNISIIKVNSLFVFGEYKYSRTRIRNPRIRTFPL
jgi:hypothetical protein